MQGHPAAAGTAAAPPPVDPMSRDEKMLLDTEFREIYRAATLLHDGRSRRGRKTKHDTATRRWLDAVGFPHLQMGKRPLEHDLAMLRMGPRTSLSGTNLAARDAWSQLHARDPRSKKQTAAQKLAQQTLLQWARSNMSNALAPATVRSGRVAEFKIDFGRNWVGHTPRALAMRCAHRPQPSASPRLACRLDAPPPSAAP